MRRESGKCIKIESKHKDRLPVLTGIGFDSSNQKETLGLPGMKERAQMIGGMFTINSKPDKGTAVFITAPLLQKNKT